MDLDLSSPKTPKSSNLDKFWSTKSKFLIILIITNFVGSRYPGICVFCVGFSRASDSLSTPMWEQLDSIAKTIKKHVGSFAKNNHFIEKSDSKINLIGYSQGGLLARAYAQVHNTPKVHNLLSISGPQAGVGHCPKWF